MTHDLLDTTSMQMRLRVVGMKRSIKCKGYGKHGAARKLLSTFSWLASGSLT